MIKARSLQGTIFTSLLIAFATSCMPVHAAAPQRCQGKKGTEGIKPRPERGCSGQFHGTMMSDIDNSMRQRHLLRLAMSQMRKKQRLAGMALAGAFMFTGLLWWEPFPLRDGARYVISGVFFLVALALQVPFLRSPCPNCGQRYHGNPNPYAGSSGAPPPCSRCGFDIDKHVTPY